MSSRTSLVSCAASRWLVKYCNSAKAMVETALMFIARNSTTVKLGSPARSETTGSSKKEAAMIVRKPKNHSRASR